MHDVNLKEGIIEPPNCIDDNFMSRVDKKMYGGERMN